RTCIVLPSYSTRSEAESRLTSTVYLTVPIKPPKTVAVMWTDFCASAAATIDASTPFGAPRTIPIGVEFAGAWTCTGSFHLLKLTSKQYSIPHAEEEIG